MNRRKKVPSSYRRQAGLVLVLVTLGMTVLLGFAALSIDINHALLNRSKLQNAVDAAALTAASLADELDDTVAATTAAKQTFTNIAGAGGGGEFDTTKGIFSFTYTNDPEVFPDNTFTTTEDIYVRISVSSYPLTSYFLQIFGINKEVTVSAVAGPSPGANKICNIVPMAVCNNGGSAEDGWGYGTGNITALKLPDSTSSPMGSGNYQLLDFGSGGSDVKNYLAGDYAGCVDIDGDVTTKPGNTIGPVGQGLNTRFGDYGGGLSSSDYPPDIYVGEPTTEITVDTNGVVVNPDNWTSADYESGKQACLNGSGSSCSSNPGIDRRMLAVPVIDCANPSGGVNDYPVDGVGCFLLMQRAPNNNGGKQHVFGEFLKDCTADNSFNNGSSDAEGIYKIVLYEDPLREGS
ncbi:pilus assembly protein TadG-related protein [Vibrio sp. SCSIO 43137]|uniref:pilus assembly protein TadG-related protein n=1 Tax=Vibrio sp. SCSIO 43137 TaxID=3021011 RepID=UPI0023080163|nr:pilus assembly protein TadG-related protein [Vibrio sp. SCSIO 43137]WCE29118.1 pilus assembly protein TadG-related protein [Vibrio sp. SCSIO 43137]